MKIVRLDLLAFGPFADVSLTLDAGREGVHVIYGPNEAGKTSALRALRQLLYGIPHTSEDDFRHAHQDLRIGAVLRRANGELLECIRRKGRGNTLRGPDDATVLDPGCLSSFLGGIDEAAFEMQFGIDSESLQRGGQAMAEGGGDLAQLLFAAGAGLADLGSVQQRLDKQADELFKPRGQNQRINKALADLAQASRELKATLLPSSEWTEHEKTLHEAEARAQSIGERICNAAAEQGRLERIQKALPLLAPRQTLREECRAVADAPILSAAFSEGRRQAESELVAARRIGEELRRRVSELDGRILELNPPDDLLQTGPAIEQLFADLGGYRKAASDRPGLVKQRQQLETDIRRLLRDLGRQEDMTEVQQLRINPAQRLRIRTLGNEQQRLEAAHATCLRTIERYQEEADEAQIALDSIPPTRDFKPLKRAVQRARQHGPLDQHLAAVREELRQLERQTEAELARLGLWNGTLAEFETLAVPAAETIDHFDSELERMARSIRSQQEKTDSLREDLRDARENLDQLRRHHDVPTEDDLRAARQSRDESWSLVKQTWLADDNAPGSEQRFNSRFEGSDNLADAFEASVSRADQVADRLRREATRVAQKAKLTSDIESLSSRVDEGVRNLGQMEEAHRVIQEQWADLWLPLGIEPLLPREMRAWLSKQIRLIDAAQELRKTRGKLETLEQAAGESRRELSAELSNSGSVHLAADDRPFGALLERCEAVIAQCEQTEAARLQQEAEIGRMTKQVSSAIRTAHQAKDELQQWRAQWQDAIAHLELPADTSALEAHRILDAIDEILRKYDEREAISARIDGIDRFADDFHRRVAATAALLSAPVSQNAADEKLTQMHARLTAAQRIETQLKDLMIQRNQDQKQLDKVQAEVIRLEATLETMCREAGCESAEQLPLVEQRSMRRQNLERELRQLNDQLVALAAHEPLELFLQKAAQIEPTELASSIVQLRDELGRLDRERTELLETIGGEKQKLAQMDGSGRAANLRDECESLIAQVQHDARDFARLRLASAVLQKAVERYREKNQGPMLRRASEIFEELTLGSFDGLRAECHDDHELLVGIRNHQGRRETVFVSAMSDGTRDQLYLALRLAALEQFLESREPLPFIIDDVLMKFDDDRAAAALKALGGISTRTQVIFFTHHDHLVRLARDVLDEGALTVHNLSETSQSSPHNTASTVNE